MKMARGTESNVGTKRATKPLTTHTGRLMTRPYVLAVDPGKTSGWAYWYDGAIIATGEDEFIDLLTRTDMWIEAIARGQGVIVCERYIINKGTLEKSRQYWSLEIIGALRYLCLKHDVEFVLQSPSDAKAFSDNEKLRRMDWYVRGKQHANDALRHLLLYLVKSGNPPPELTSYL